MMKWFVLENDEVRGPFSEEQIQAQLTSQIITAECQLWTKGMKTWAPSAQWQNGLKDQPMNATQAEQKRMWHYAFEGQAHGPLPLSVMLGRLEALGDRFSEVLLWTKGMKNWAPLFEFHEILDELNINRRQHPRAPIEGQVVLRVGEKQIIGTLKSISQGGFGVGRLEGVLPGQEVSAELRAQNFHEPISVKAELRYLGESGYAGFTFSVISREATSQIVQYVKDQSKIQAAA